MEKKNLKLNESKLNSYDLILKGVKVLKFLL